MAGVHNIGMPLGQVKVLGNHPRHTILSYLHIPPHFTTPFYFLFTFLRLHVALDFSFFGQCDPFNDMYYDDPILTGYRMFKTEVCDVVLRYGYPKKIVFIRFYINALDRRSVINRF